MKPHKILIARNDKLGDFMLVWPTLMMLKQNLPKGDELWVLARDYTQDIAESCPWVDGVIVDHGDHDQLVTDLQAQQFDASIALFSTWYLAKSLKCAKIPYRLAPATKLAQILYTHRLKQRRSQSLKAEFEYNLDLARHYLTRQRGMAASELREPCAPIWQLSPQNTPRNALQGTTNNTIETAPNNHDVKRCFLHACNGGSSENLSHQQYVDFCVTLSETLSHPIEWTLTHGPGELKKITPLCERLQQAGLAVEIAPAFASVTEFAHYLAERCELFVSSATGTLHVAATLNLPTITFYPRKAASNATRWNTTNGDERKISFSPSHEVEVEDEARDIMGTLDMVQCARESAEKFNAYWSR